MASGPNSTGRLRALPEGGAHPSVASAIDFDAAYRRYGAYVAAIAIRLLGRDDEVDDVVQEVFLEALGGIGRLQDPGALKGWLATVTVRTAGRRLKRRKVLAFFGIGAGGDYAHVAGAEADPATRTLLAQVYRVLDTVPVDERIAWTLRYIEGERLDAVAQLCGCSLATAKRRISAVQRVIERVTEQ